MRKVMLAILALVPLLAIATEAQAVPRHHHHRHHHHHHPVHR